MIGAGKLLMGGGGIPPISLLAYDTGIDTGGGASFSITNIDIGTKVSDYRAIMVCVLADMDSTINVAHLDTITIGGTAGHVLQTHCDNSNTVTSTAIAGRMASSGTGNITISGTFTGGGGGGAGSIVGVEIHVYVWDGIENVGAFDIGAADGANNTPNPNCDVTDNSLSMTVHQGSEGGTPPNWTFDSAGVTEDQDALLGTSNTKEFLIGYRISDSAAVNYDFGSVNDSGSIECAGITATILGAVPPHPQPTLTKTADASSGSNLTTYTFSSLSLGAAASDRKMIAAITGVDSGTARTISSVTIGGVSATQIAFRDVGNGPRYLAVYEADVPTGTTGDVVVTWSGGMSDCEVCLYRGVGTFGTPVIVDFTTGNNNAEPPKAVVTAIGPGVALAMSTSSTDTWIWTGATEQIDEALGTERCTHALISAAGEVTAKNSDDNQINIMAVTW